MCLQTKRFTLVDVPSAGASVQKHMFQPNSTLENATRITAIEAYKVGAVSVSPESMAPNVNDTVFANSFLTLMTKEGDVQVITRMPLADLNRQANHGELQQFDIPQLNISKCFIEVAVTAGQVATEHWVLGFHFGK